MNDIFHHYSQLVFGATVGIVLLIIMGFIFLDPTGPMTTFLMQYIGVYF